MTFSIILSLLSLLPMIRMAYGLTFNSIALYFTNKLRLRVESEFEENFDPQKLDLPLLHPTETHMLFGIKEVPDTNVDIYGDISDYVPLPDWAKPHYRPSIVYLWQQLGRVPTQEELFHYEEELTHQHDSLYF